jgi:hypothetical protein
MQKQILEAGISSPSPPRGEGERRDSPKREGEKKRVN